MISEFERNTSIRHDDARPAPEGQAVFSAAPCPHFGSCGGCKYLDRPYEAQLQIKEEETRRLLTEGIQNAAKYVGEEAVASILAQPDWWEGILPSPRPFAYRNKMEFSFGDECKDGPLALGLHKRGSFYDIVTVDGCQIVDEDYRQILKGTLEYFAGTGLRHYHKKRRDGTLRHLLVRKALHTGEILVDLVTTGDFPGTAGAHAAEELLRGFVERLLALPLEGQLVGILHTKNDAVADVIRDEGTAVLYGRDHFFEELLGLRFRVTPFSFFQTNSFGAEVLYETARRYMREALGNQDQEKKPGTIFDLYCGTGTITQLLATAADRVVGVELVPEAVEAARESAAANGISNCRFLAGDVFRVLEDLSDVPDAILLDPPREGLHPKALRKILSYGVKNIVYVSCKPKSLAGELPAFLGAGYRPVRAVCVDEFPWTANVEACILLSKPT